MNYTRVPGQTSDASRTYSFTLTWTLGNRLGLCLPTPRPALRGMIAKNSVKKSPGPTNRQTRQAEQEAGYEEVEL